MMNTMFRNIGRTLRQANPVVGLLLVMAGVLTLAVSYVCRLTSVNALQMGAVLLIVAGVVAYVMLQKWQSKY